MRPLHILPALVICLLAAGAGAQTLALHADFDLDTPGETPNTSPPGDPAGDALSLWLQGGSITVETAFAGIGSQPLVLDRQIPSEPFAMHAELDPDLWFCDRYTVRWRSASMDNVFFVSFAMWSDNSQLLATLEYRTSYALSFIGSSHPVPVSYSIGTMQEFIVTLDMVDKKASLSVDGVAFPELQDLNQYQIGGDGMRAFAFGVGGLDASTFVLDDIEVTADCGNTAATTTSLSAVRSLYR